MATEQVLERRSEPRASPDGTSIWTRSKVFAALDAGGIPRNDYPERDYGIAKRYLMESYQGEWLDESEYHEFIGWICDWVGL